MSLNDVVSAERVHIGFFGLRNAGKSSLVNAVTGQSLAVVSDVRGNNLCHGHTECDAIIMDNGSVSAVPKVSANSPDASLVHEAAIGKIAGEQLVKLMTLGLTEKEAEEQIIAGFLK